MKKMILFMLALCSVIAASAQPATERAKAYRVYTFSIAEDIAPPATKRVEAAMAEAHEVKADLIVVTINTYGGTLDDADRIRTAFLQSDIPVYAFINNNAASAGALISIACDSIYMHSGSSIGSATVVNQTGEVQPDKYQSYMRSLMRSTAEARHRRPDIAEAMVDPDISVAGISDSGKVLAFTTQEAIRHHYCEGQCESVREVLQHAGIAPYTIHEQRYTFIQKVIGFLVNPVVSSILIMLIVGGIYFELHSPGIGFPLIVAVIGALLYFAPLYLQGLAANWEILLFVAGIVLLALEIFVIPGFGVAGISGIVCIVVGLAFSMVGNVGFDFSVVPIGQIAGGFLTVLVAFVVALPLSMFLAQRLLEHSRLSSLALQATQRDSDGFTTADPAMERLVGSSGTAYTLLRPAGKVQVGEAVYDALTRSGYIERGSAVRVVGYENNTLVVEALSE